MLALLVALSLGQSAAAPQPPRTSRDIAVVGPAGEATGTPRPELSTLSDADLEKRIAAMKKENARAFSDRRVLLLEELEAEKDRRRHEREWEEVDRRREAERAAQNEKLEAQYHAEQSRQREADEAARSALAAARAAAEEEVRTEAEQRARERRRTLIRWSVLGVVALIGAAVALALRGRR